MRERVLITIARYAQDAQCKTVTLKNLSQWTYGFSRRSWFPDRPNRGCMCRAGAVRVR